MSFPHRVAKVTFSGTMFNGAEVWSTGFHLGWEGQDATPITEQGVADVGLAWETLFKNAGAFISSRYTFTQAKIAMLNNDGKTIPDSAVYWGPALPVVGGGGAFALPPQNSLVVSLGNSQPRGLAAKGRMFVPGINAQIEPTGHIHIGVQTTVADAFETFFDTVYNDADLPGQPVLASLGRGPLKEGGTIRYITKIRVGNVIDTQRRRRNGLAETYLERAVASGN